MNTLEDNIKQFIPAIRLEKLLSRRTMTALRYGFFIIAALFATVGVLSLWWQNGNYSSQFFGVALVAFALWFEQLLTYAYHNSFYFRGLYSVIGLDEKSTSGTTYDVAAAVLRKPDDVTFAFCTSTLGTTVLLRAGVSSDAQGAFLTGPRQKISANMVTTGKDNEVFSLINLGMYLFRHDAGFKNLLKEAGVLEHTFTGALRFVIDTHHEVKRQKRWWGKDNLSRTTGIGREWTYGTAYLLERYARDIRTSAVFSTLTHNAPFANEKITEIETILARAKASNVLIIGEPGVGKVDLVMEIERRIQNGTSLDAISGQRIIVLDTNRLFAIHKEKQALELTLIRLFDEALRAGNITIVLENLSSFVREAEAMGVYLPELLDQYLASPALHVIATDTPDAYHNVLEPLGAFTRRFAEVLIDTPNLLATTRVLEGVALKTELQYHLLFTYAGLEAIASAADRYLVEGVMPERAIELLIDIATRARQNNVTTITADYVFGVVGEKTGVPAGPVTSDERALLLHLEDRLHEQVVGQQPALRAIARAMRRARAGIQAADKPIGSFLFLGPTGVGKTETAKALARIFFGSEEHLRRLDMSEFSGEDALARLIGHENESGVLADMLREHPYSVLLLDEFEKAAKTVHDLFLQILDEGRFTDARNTKVNARNTIIIATSNAGSQLIIKTVQQRNELAHLSQYIIDNIIREGLFRPELINRFDSTIIFEPLSHEEQAQVASLMLGELYTRIKERGYDLQVTKDLLEVLVQKGYSPEFGARPMQRVLQDIIEEKVAKKIIAGAVERGDTITLSKVDFAEEELDVTNA
ncbi:MAG: AAA family ATPase [Patescibacteria group bacterium]